MRSLHSSGYKLLLERLQAARREAGLTQAAVAKTFGRHQSFVSKCESGERRVDVLELTGFAQVYGKPLAFFVAETEGLAGASLSLETAEPAPRPRPYRTRRGGPRRRPPRG